MPSSVTVSSLINPASFVSPVRIGQPGGCVGTPASCPRLSKLAGNAAGRLGHPCQMTLRNATSLRGTQLAAVNGHHQTSHPGRKVLYLRAERRVLQADFRIFDC